MSFLIWRILKNWLPIDTLLHQKGLGSLRHGVWLRKKIFTQLHHVFKAWSLTVSEKGHIRWLIPVLVLCSLWVARNKAKHGGIAFMGLSRVLIIASLSLCNPTCCIINTGGVDLEVAALFDVHPLKPRPKKPVKLMWVKLPRGILKLNIDGAFKDDWRGLGGIIRDDQGSIIMVVGFCFAYYLCFGC
ncbi:hypothetical protein LIER_18922 [Lithospermum erythrorhizon]|uniref:Reverse transcriptase zinc-binding domain-containing protein n=1 Tax=Lithospermum erythrorhizon TaxID=34254 RepID=A0AAV3QIS6_LITER